MTPKLPLVLLAVAVALSTCAERSSPLGASQRGPKQALSLKSGRDVFRYATFGNEQLWTGALQMHEVISTSVSPSTALSVGLKVDSDALPPRFLDGADLGSPATTVALIGLNAVVGVQGKVVEGQLTVVGITCALCHSTVDDSVAPGVGRRLDGWPNLDLDPGLIISLSPALTQTERTVYRSWGPGLYDPRYNLDGLNDPVVIPPVYGLAGVPAETYTGDGPISSWNAFVAVTQLGGKGSFIAPRLEGSVVADPDLTPRLPALLDYQLSLAKPPPPAGSFNAAAASRGKLVFEGQGLCASCHEGTLYTERALHAAAETGMDPLYASRSATRQYRVTPLRALWQHPPYFHDGSAQTLAEVVDHYDATLELRLSSPQKVDLVEFLKSL